MKNLILSSIAFSALSMNAFANPNSGALTVGKLGKNVVVSFSGGPAKKVFNVLAVKGNDVKLNTNTNGVLKNGTDISCLNVLGIDAYECKLLLNAKGDSVKLPSFKTVAAKKTVGFSTAGGFGDYANVSLDGAAANDIVRNLTEANTTSKRTGSLLTTSHSGLSISCTTSTAVVVSSVCRFSVNTNGNVDSRLLK